MILDKAVTLETKGVAFVKNVGLDTAGHLIGSPVLILAVISFVDGQITLEIADASDFLAPTRKNGVG